MHYYKKNLGDYAKKAGRLSLLQHGVYNQLIDACYDRESFPTLDQAIDWVWASTPEEVDAVKLVLSKFFKKEGDIYIQPRIESELQEYQGQCQANAINGKKGGRPKKTSDQNKNPSAFQKKPFGLNKNPDESDLKPNGSEKNPKPLTTNQEPNKKNKQKKTGLQEYLDQCKTEGKAAVPENSAVFKNAETIGLDGEMVLVCWGKFKDYYLGDGKNKKYTDWLGTFNNNVKNNYYQLWWTNDGGEVAWTSKGNQARKLFKE